MSDLTAKFEALEAQLAAQATATNGYIDTVEAKLQSIFDELDLMLVNNAANTRALLAALGSNSPCMPCPTPPLVIPPIGTTPLPVNSTSCKRAQAFLNFMDQVFTVLDLASAVGIGFNPTLVTDAFNQVIAGLSGGDSPDTISFPEAAQLVGDLVSYIASNLLVGHTLLGLFTPLYADLRDALAGAGSADEAKVQYDTIVTSAGMGSFEYPVIRDAAYGAAYTYFFDPASDPDLSGISGTACLGSACFVFESETQSFSGTPNGNGVVWTSIFEPTDHVGAFFGDGDYWATLDLAGWKVKPSQQVVIFQTNGDAGTGINAGTVYTIPATTTFVAIRRNDATLFTVQVCPPGINPV